jgi:hypothetical protein
VGDSRADKNLIVLPRYPPELLFRLSEGLKRLFNIGARSSKRVYLEQATAHPVPSLNFRETVETLGLVKTCTRGEIREVGDGEVLAPSSPSYTGVDP